MALYTYKEYSPEIKSNVYIAPSADIIGRVTLFDHVSIWHQSVVRGDVNKICIGENTNVQDLSVLHVTKDNSLNIGKNVSIGHSVTLHGCTILDGALIGMGAIVMDGSVIGECSVVAGGSVVPPNKQYPEKSMIMGNPAKVIRPLTDDEVNNFSNHFRSYLRYKDEYLDESLVKLIKQ
jgi:carbonic anhydrase/acetyltransferase-like protein (isoleucine patch superfamily)